MRALIGVLVLLVVLASAARDASANTCSFGTMTGVNFGTYNVFVTSDMDVTGSFTFNCSSTQSVTFAINAGSGSISDRTMRSASTGSVLHYQLYTDIFRSITWGDGVTGSLATAIPLLGFTTTQSVFGRLFARQNVKPATDYTDSLTVTINY